MLPLLRCVSDLIRMGRCYEENGASSGDAPRPARMHFPEEEVDKDRHGPKDKVVEPWYHLGDILFLRHGGGIRLLW